MVSRVLEVCRVDVRVDSRELGLWQILASVVINPREKGVGQERRAYVARGAGFSRGI